MNLFLNDFFFLLPELFWVFGITALLLFSTVLTKELKLILITNFGFFNFFLIFLFLVLVWNIPAYEYTLLQYQYTATFFHFCFKLIFLFLLVICVFLSLNYFFFERVYFVEYYFLIGFFCISAIFLMSANDFVLFYFAVELQALILYTLAAFKRYTVFSTESGLKYFVLGALSSGLLLFGISLFYGFFGTFNFYDLKFVFLKWSGIQFFYGAVMAMLFVFAGLLFKLSAAPFHIWAPDVYEGAPTPIVLFFAILPKLAMFVFIVRFFLIWAYDLGFIWYLTFFFVGLVSVFWGTLAALNQLNIKRLYAYSAITNIGYLLSILAYGTYDSFVAVFNYLTIYFFSTVALFAIILLFRRVSGLSKIKFLVDYRAYSSYSFVLGLLISLIFFSLAGIPPLSGFFVKFFLFKSMFAADFLTNSAFFVILTLSVASAFYYIRVVRFIFFNTARQPVLFMNLSFSGAFLLVNLLLFISLFALFQSTIYAFLSLALNSLFF